MKKIIWLIFVLLYVCALNVHAQDYTLKEKKEIKANYAGLDDYNYIKIVPSKSGFAEIKVKTSDSDNFIFDICNNDKEVIAQNISVKNKKTILHKVKKGNFFYIRSKGKEEQQYTVSYKIVKFDSLSYAKKYAYNFTSVSFHDKKDALLLKIKASETGNLYFMCNTSDKMNIQFLNAKKKAISNISNISGHSINGIGVEKNKVYYIKLWELDNKVDGTTEISDIKYQIEGIMPIKNNSIQNAKILSNSAKGFIAAGSKKTVWYKINLSNEKKIFLEYESHLLQNSKNGVKLYICNEKGKTLHKEPIIISEKVQSFYKKKYKMKYPIKKISTGILPEGKYYIKIQNNNKVSGFYKISWK